MSIKKNKNQLIISILVGLAIFIVTYQFVIKQHQENIHQREEIEKLKSGIGIEAVNSENSTIYVVAKKDIPKNYVITSDDIEMKDLGMKINGACNDKKNAIGAKTTAAITIGRPVITKDIIVKEETTGAEEPRPGFRAVAATIAANKIPPFVKDNVNLDVYTANDTFRATNVRIIKVSDTSNKSNKLVIFEIKEEDVGAFILGMNTDKLIPVQKNSNDKTAYSFSFDSFEYPSEEIINDYKPEPVPVNNTNYTVPVNNVQKKTETVELIQGNVVKTLDF